MFDWVLNTFLVGLIALEGASDGFMFSLFKVTFWILLTVKYN